MGILKFQKDMKVISKLTTTLLYLFFWLLAILDDTSPSSDCLSEVGSQNGYVGKTLLWQKNVLHIQLVEEKVDSNT